MRTPGTAPPCSPLIITGLVNTSDNLLFFTVIIIINNTVTVVMIIIILRYSLLPLSSEMINIFNVTIDMAVVSLISEFQIDVQVLGQVPGISTIWNAFGLVVRRKSFGRKFNQIWKTLAAQRVPPNKIILRLYNDSHFHHFKDLKSVPLVVFTATAQDNKLTRIGKTHLFFFATVNITLAILLTDPSQNCKVFLSF